MQDKPLIIGVCIVVFFVLIFTYIEVKNKGKLTLELSNVSIKANMYDDIYLENYISEARDSRKNNLKDKVKIEVDCDEQDIVNNNVLTVKGIGSKVITYSLEKGRKTIIKKLIIKVITDPNDPDFKPNYEGMQRESQPNLDDIPVIIE